MAKKVFLSFRYDDVDLAHDLRSFFAKWGGPVQATPIYVTQDLSKQGEDAIKAEIKRVMSGCVGLVVIAGNNTHNSPWIEWEVALAGGWAIPKVALRHPARTGAPPRATTHLKEVDWSPAAVADLVAGWG